MFNVIRGVDSRRLLYLVIDVIAFAATFVRVFYFIFMIYFSYEIIVRYKSDFEFDCLVTKKNLHSQKVKFFDWYLFSSWKKMNDSWRQAIGSREKFTLIVDIDFGLTLLGSWLRFQGWYMVTGYNSDRDGKRYGALSQISTNEGSYADITKWSAYARYRRRRQRSVQGLRKNFSQNDCRLLTKRSHETVTNQLYVLSW